MLVQTCDPATETPGYALGGTKNQWFGFGRVPLLRCEIFGLSLTPHDAKTHIAVVEAQYMGDASKQAISTLSFDAGFRLASMQAERYYSVTPRIWKTALLGGYRFPKAVACARIRDNLTAEELSRLAEFPENRHGDILDAIGILWAWPAVQPKQRKEHKK